MEIHQDIIRRSGITPLGGSKTEILCQNYGPRLGYGDLALEEARNNLLVRS
jgi:hypothetical protein